MSPILRTCMLWLLALAVPFQGAAAAALMPCGPSRHDATAAHRHVVAPAEASGIGAGPAARALDVPSAERGHGAADGHAPTDHAAASTVSKGACTPCAACGAVAALPPAAVAFEAEPGRRDFFVLPVTGPFAPFLTDGPERPPRSISA